MPTVSVIMPCYNHAAYLRESISSVLAQSFGDLELIVTDDCSSDGSRDILRSLAHDDPRVLPVFHDVNGGEAKSRNDAVAVAQGEFIGFCDSDDLWERDKLARQLKYLEDHAESNAVHSDSIIIDGTGKPTGEKFSTRFQHEQILEGELFLRLCLRNFVNVPTVLLRRKCIDDAGIFEPEFRYLTDWIYWAKVAKTNLFGYIDEPLARYRIHGASTLHDDKRYPIYRIMGYKLLLERYPEIPRYIRTKMEYLIGVNNVALGNIPEARTYFRKAVGTQLTNVKGIYRFLEVSLGSLGRR